MGYNKDKSEDRENGRDESRSRPGCPYCGSTNTELFSLFGQQLLTVQYYCNTCRTPFEHIKDDDVLDDYTERQRGRDKSSPYFAQALYNADPKGRNTVTTTTEQTLVNYTVTDGIAVIELYRPPANTYSYEMM